MDRYFQTKYFLEYVIPFTLIGIYILISCVQAYKEYKIDEFMRSQGYNLKGDKSDLAWYDGNTFIEYQMQSYSFFVWAENIFTTFLVSFSISK